MYRVCWSHHLYKKRDLHNYLLLLVLMAFTIIFSTPTNIEISWGASKQLCDDKWINDKKKITFKLRIFSSFVCLFRSWWKKCIHYNLQIFNRIQISNQRIWKMDFVIWKKNSNTNNKEKKEKKSLVKTNRMTLIIISIWLND